MSNEIVVASAWIYRRIVTDAGMIAAFAGRGVTPPGQTWEYRAPADVSGAAIVYQKIGGAGDVRGIGGPRIYTRMRYLIRVSDVGEDWDHADLADRIDALFGFVVNVPVTNPTGYIHACSRVEPYDLPEEIGGVQYRNLGGLFDLSVSAA